MKPVNHRFEAIEETDVKSPYLWCLHCERTYPRDEYRIETVDGEEFQMCPYEDCDGTTVLDGWDWETVRGYGNQDYPIVPERGVTYPLYKTDR